jgi:hypothetical protein
MRVAVGLGNLPLNECGPITYGEVEDYEVIISPDRTAPKITILGADMLTLNQCDAYTDAGATAWDNIDGDVTQKIVTSNNLNTSVPGNYTYTYSVKDVAGNVGHATRYITVDPDTIGPNVFLMGAVYDSVEVFSNWTDPGYTVTKRCVSVVGQNVSGTVNTSVVGEYPVVYSAEDSLGNMTEVTRYVKVVDTEDPVIALNGNAVETVEVFDTYTDPGVTITDNYYTGLTATVTGTVNTSVVGDYVLEYSVTDGSGNGPVTITRTVKVVDTQAPEIVSYVYKQNQEILLDVNHSLTKPIFKVEDNYYDKSSLTITETGTFYSTFPTGLATVTGTYTYVYTVEDGSANIATFNLTIKVVDREAPVISLEGNPIVTICRFEEIDDDVTVTDNYDQNVQVTMTGTYVTDYLVNMAPGYYYVVYGAQDAAMNTAQTVTRSVQVFDIGEGGCTSAIGENTLANSVSVYPNPSKGLVNVSVALDKASDLNIVITNALGQVVYSGAEYNVSTQVISLNLDLSNGMYNINLQTQEGSVVFPIVIAK